MYSTQDWKFINTIINTDDNFNYFVLQLYYNQILIPLVKKGTVTVPQC